MEQGPKARAQEPDKVKVDLRAVRAAKGPAQIPAVDREKNKAEERVEAESKAPDKAKIKAFLVENKISNDTLQKNNFLI